MVKEVFGSTNTQVVHESWLVDCYLCRNNAETPPTHATGLARQASTTLVPVTDNVPQPTITQEEDHYYEISLQGCWIYEEAAPIQKETVQSVLYQSLESLHSEVGIDNPNSPPQGELRYADHAEYEPMPPYMTLEEQNEARQKETVESALYQSVEELRDL
jgi:hypothetical protein